MEQRHKNGKLVRPLPVVILHVEPSATRDGMWAVRREHAVRPMKTLSDVQSALAYGRALAAKKGWQLDTTRADDAVRIAQTPVGA